MSEEHRQAALTSVSCRSIRIMKLHFYNSTTLFLLVAIEKDGVTENAYMLVLSWNAIEAGHGDRIRQHSFGELVNESFSIWPCTDKFVFGVGCGVVMIRVSRSVIG